jgi:hypothetical protein
MPLMRRNVTIRRSRAAGFARLAGGLALPVLLLGIVGMRVGLVPQQALLPVIVAGFTLGIVALGLAIYSLADIWISGAEGAGSAFAGIFYASPVLVVLGLIAAAATLYPRLSDVSTDLADPPRFFAPGGSHAAPDAAAVARQASSYPEIAPRVYPLPLGNVFEAAAAVIDDNGWVVTREVRPPELPVATAPATLAPVLIEDIGLIEALAGKSTITHSRSGMATETLPLGTAPPTIELAVLEAKAPTPLFGFVDDVVVRMRVAEDGATIVDMRSASRLGMHDLGQNARRIRAFLAKLDAILQPEPGATD